MTLLCASIHKRTKKNKTEKHLIKDNLVQAYKATRNTTHAHSLPHVEEVAQ